MDHTVWFRWLGVAGIELRVNEQILALDPFLTRPPFRRMWFGRVRSDSALVVTTIPQCNVILITHAHHDHLMDVPEIIQQTGATAYGASTPFSQSVPSSRSSGCDTRRQFDQPCRYGESQYFLFPAKMRQSHWSSAA